MRYGQHPGAMDAPSMYVDPRTTLAAPRLHSPDGDGSIEVHSNSELNDIVLPEVNYCYAVRSLASDDPRGHYTPARCPIPHFKLH